MQPLPTMEGKPARPTRAEVALHALMCATAIAGFFCGIAYEWLPPLIDFGAYYHGAQDVAHDPGNLYEWARQPESRIDLVRSPYIYPPMLAGVIGPLGLLSMNVAGNLWRVMDLAAFVIAVWVLGKLAPTGGRRGLLLSAAVLLPAAGIELLRGQTNGVLLMCIAGAMLLAQRQRGFAAAVLLVLAGGIKLLPLALLPLLWMQCGRRAIAGTLLGGLLVMCAPLPWLLANHGLDGLAVNFRLHTEYLFDVLLGHASSADPVRIGGQGIGNYSYGATLVRVYDRLDRGVGLTTLAYWLPPYRLGLLMGLMLYAVALVTAWRSRRDPDRAWLAWPPALCLLWLGNLTTWLAHLVILAPLVVVFHVLALERKRPLWAPVAVVVILLAVYLPFFMLTLVDRDSVLLRVSRLADWGISSAVIVWLSLTVCAMLWGPRPDSAATPPPQ
ncbi:MAG: DUF2029 domain-containing protein [Planctomycetes bacterium]|nr:DUF2029 domain-containing protein [Planctomycetota bacterium]MCW8137206.1 DUF2029 domain-containing protein [Planctomycetota bacterium]